MEPVILTGVLSNRHSYTIAISLTAVVKTINALVLGLDKYLELTRYRC